MEKTELRKVLEAFLFVSPSPVQIVQVKEALDIEEESVIKAAFDELKGQYESSDTM